MPPPIPVPRLTIIRWLSPRAGPELPLGPGGRVRVVVDRDRHLHPPRQRLAQRLVTPRQVRGEHDGRPVGRHEPGRADPHRHHLTQPVGAHGLDQLVDDLDDGVLHDVRRLRPVRRVPASPGQHRPRRVDRPARRPWSRRCRSRSPAGRSSRLLRVDVGLVALDLDVLAPPAGPAAAAPYRCRATGWPRRRAACRSPPRRGRPAGRGSRGGPCARPAAAGIRDRGGRPRRPGAVACAAPGT